MASKTTIQPLTPTQLAAPEPAANNTSEQDMQPLDTQKYKTPSTPYNTTLTQHKS